jgi:mgtE-like transporter
VRVSAGPPSRRRPAPWWRRAAGALRSDYASARQSIVGLAINSSTSLIAGLFIAAIADSFALFPGLLVMVPAAIGLRGNVFSALGSRVSTSIHAGDYRASLRFGSVMGDNAASSVALTAVTSFGLALVAAAVAVVFGVEGDVSVLDLVTISIIGGLLASALVLVITLTLVAAAVRSDWDLDNLVAPVVSTFGDVITVPSLWLATLVVGTGMWATAESLVLAMVALAVGAVGWWSSHERIRRIMRESVPVLLVAGALSTMAGLVLEKQLDTLQAFGALIILQPAFVSSAGALGGLLASTLASGLHLGTIEPLTRPVGAVWREVRILALAAVPVYLFNGAGSDVLARLTDAGTPGLGLMIAVALLGAVGAVAFVVVVAYYGSIVAVRFGVDPDTYGIPIVTSSVDFVGVVALILAASAFGLTR